MPATAEEIQSQMRQMRCELGEDMEGLMANARIMSDWRYYVRSYPWACLGVAAAAGFLLVPTRPQLLHTDASALADELARRKVVVGGTGAEVQAKPKAGVLAALAAMAGNAILHGGLSLGKAKLAEFAQQQWQQGRHEPAASDGGARHR